KAFGLIGTVRNRFDHTPCGNFRLIPDFGNTGLHRGAAIARDQLSVTPRPELTRGDLRPQIAEACIRIADVVANDLPERLVAPARLIDLERAHLQPFGVDVVGIGRTETLVRTTDIDPMGAVGGEPDQFAGMKARGIDDHVVEMLAADLALV